MSLPSPALDSDTRIVEDLLEVVRRLAVITPSVYIMDADSGDYCPVVSDQFAPWQAAGYVTHAMGNQWTVYPSGLALPTRQVQAVWEFPDRYRFGTAEQAVRYAQRSCFDRNAIWPVDPDRLHGLCVRIDWAENLQSHRCPYNFVQAIPFPAWCR